MKRLTEEVQLMFRRPEQTQYAALCYRNAPAGLEVLLLTSRETGRWVVPKGWPMDGKKCHEVAEREAYEEAGVKGKAEKQPLGYYHYEKGMKNGLSVTCKVHLYPLAVDEMLAKFPEKGTRTLEWVPCAIAAERVNEPELKALISAFPDHPLPQPKNPAKSQK